MAVPFCRICETFNGCCCHVIVCLEGDRPSSLLLFWRPKGAGYTNDLGKAGRWPSYEEAAAQTPRDWPVALSSIRERAMLTVPDEVRALIPGWKPGRTDRSAPEKPKGRR